VTTRQLARVSQVASDMDFFSAALRNIQQENLFAAEALERYLSNDPSDAPLRIARAEALLDGGDVPRALEEASTALELDRQAPDPRKLTDPRPLASLAVAAAAAGEKEQASALAELALKLDAPVSLYAPRKLTNQQHADLLKLL
jgi:hypothetical protein